jgi:regulator of sigma E protease
LTTGNPGFLWTVFSFLIVIGPLIFVHELGHYFVGRWFGVKAEAFSIGFGREILGWTDRRGTRWKVGWLPMGGYVRFAGDMNPASQPSAEWLNLPAEERNRTFQSKPVWQRFLIVAAGPVTNFIVAILIFTAFFASFGEPHTPPIVEAVQPNSAAAAAGLRPGDRITSVDGETVSRFEDIFELVVLRPGDTVPIGFVRQGREMQVDATLRPDTQKDKFGNSMKKGLLGISNRSIALEQVSVPEAFAASLRQSWSIVTMTVDGIGQMIVGKRSLDELGGPLKTAKFSGEQATLGPLALIWFMAAISINLGFINLLPIPMLDGGHLLFYAIEGARRRPLRPEAQDWAFRTGLAMLLVLMIFVTLNDLASFGLWSMLGGLMG